MMKQRLFGFSALCFSAMSCLASDFFSEDLGNGHKRFTATKEVFSPNIGKRLNVDNKSYFCTVVAGFGYHLWAALPDETPMTFELAADTHPEEWRYTFLGNGNDMGAAAFIRLIDLPPL